MNAKYTWPYSYLLLSNVLHVTENLRVYAWLEVIVSFKFILYFVYILYKITL